MGNSMSQYMFHVRHNARPDSLQAFIELVNEYPGADDETLIANGAAQGSRIGTAITSVQSLRENVAQVLRDFSLLEQETNHLTKRGMQLCELVYTKPALLAEVMHFFFYSTWYPSAPSQNCFSWTYMTTVQQLWSSIQAALSFKQLASDLEARAKQVFPDAKISISADTMRGVMNWLRPLSPAVLDERDNTKRFTRRSFCPPELFVLAIDHIYGRKGIQYGSNLLMEPEMQEQICQICVLEPEGFERVAEYATLQFPFLAQGMGGGWGSYLRLDRAPSLDDLR
jgi:hypothetical protein